MADAAIRVEGLRKSYAGKGLGHGELELFSGLDFLVRAGEMVAIVGESGAGKSSLLHLLAALDRPTAGEVWVGEQRLSALSGAQAAEFRNRKVGYVWQFHYLMPEFTAAENVAMPLLARGDARRAAMSKAKAWLGEVGLGDRAEHRSGELSGGEQQRVSLARALVTEPKALLADEPTGNVDPGLARRLLRLFVELHRLGTAVVIATHDLQLMDQFGFARRLVVGDSKLTIFDGLSA